LEARRVQERRGEVSLALLIPTSRQHLTRATRGNGVGVHTSLGVGLTDRNTQRFFLNLQQFFFHLPVKHLRVSHGLKIVNTSGAQLFTFWCALDEGCIGRRMFSWYLFPAPFRWGPVFVALARSLTEVVTEAT